MGLRQKDLAQLIGAAEQSICFWEMDKTRPIHKYIPKIIAFLGYDPFPQPKALSDRLKRYRLVHGLTQRELARQLRVSPGAITLWEDGQNEPTGRSVETLDRLGLE